MALLGDLVVRLDADSQKFEQGLQRSRKQLKQFENSTLATVLSGNKFKSSLTQMSFAADDFFGVLQNSGDVGAAIRATSNNIGTMVTMINPLAGIATTLGLALGTALIPKLFGTGDAAKKAAGGFDSMTEAMERAEQEQRKLEQFTADSSRIRGLFDVESIDDEVRRIKGELETLTKERDTNLQNAARFGFDGDPLNVTLDQDIARLNSQLERLAVNRGVADFNRQVEQLNRLEDIGSIGSLDTVTDQIDDARDALAKMQREMQAIGRNLAILEDIDPTGKLPEFDQIFKEQDRRLEAMKDIRKEIQALEAQEQKLLDRGEAAPNLPALEDPKITKAVQQIEVTQKQTGPEKPQFAGFAARGTAEAFSAILKATRQSPDSQSLASIAKATAATAKTNEKIAKAAEKKAQPKAGKVELAVVDNLQ